jgi:hypothetical protein
MESSRRVGLPPVYEDANTDALCQLIGTFYEAINYYRQPEGTAHSLYEKKNSAHARPLDIHQRPYPTLPVSVSSLSLVSGHIADICCFLPYLFFLGGRGRMYHLDHLDPTR